MPHALGGVYVANVTPFRDDADRTLDLDAYRAHVRWLAGPRGGRGGPVRHQRRGPVGHDRGEGRRCSTRSSPTTSGIGLLPTVAEGNLPDTLALLEHINDLPVVGVLVLPPYYFKPVETDGLRRFFERVLEVARHPVVGVPHPEVRRPGAGRPGDLAAVVGGQGLRRRPGVRRGRPGGRAGRHARHRGRPARPAARRGRGDLRAGEHRARAAWSSSSAACGPATSGQPHGSPPTCGGARDDQGVRLPEPAQAPRAGPPRRRDGDGAPPLVPAPETYDVAAALERLGVSR